MAAGCQPAALTDNEAMARRFPVADVRIGTTTLDATQSRHARDVMRLRAGDMVELFDGKGRSGSGRIMAVSPEVQVCVEHVEDASALPVKLTIAAATPKGNRADWMVEKLSELGVDTLIPLASSRTVVHPEQGKLSRWGRIAAESAKQCRRSSIMNIAAPATVNEICQIAPGASRWCLATEVDAMPINQAIATLPPGEVVAAIGPEGGWTEKEIGEFLDAGFVPVRLTTTVLRIETAAIALASLVMTSGAATGGVTVEKEPGK